ncbi:alpha/beta hydrolase fold domain-containing protein [Sphingomonas lenta]|uniref:Alpha/beta hydrolase n=1 Tax=Sphingomonas lenta TaxID=1141887 RepID=A0A2A2SC65_9SPHN|nr:alpha/beta hydrolase fold domain-containing protein [Sphingomonas lenta]PAX06785.1 alpha/beta hydrolase [Sphingomonas lenta]
MSLEEAAAIAAGMRAAPKGLPVEQRRAGFEARAAATPLPADARFEDVAFAPGLTGLRVTVPESDADRVLLWFHGGAFVLGSSASWRRFACDVARAARVSVLLPDYRLAPEHPFPAAHEDALAACDWLDAQGVPPERRTIGGDSAGGNLALGALAARAEKAGFAAAWLVSPYLDLTNSGSSIIGRRTRDAFVDPDDGTNARWLGGADPRDPRASPLFADLSELPPTLVQVGSEEVLYDDARRLADRAPQAVFQEWVGMGHVFPLFAPALEEGRHAIAQGGAFLRLRLGLA